MARTFGLVLMLVALYVGMTIYTRGVEHLFGGAFAPIQPMSQREAPLATHLTPAAQLSDEPADRERRVWITDAVREQVNADIQAGSRRRGN